MKNYKKIWFILSPITLFFLSTITHSIYDKFPFLLTKIFFPVNESIWEHNKMIIMAYFIFMLIEGLIFKKLNFNYIWASIVCSLLVILIFSPIYFCILKGQDNLIVTLIIYFICLCLSQLYFYFLKPHSPMKISILLWLLVFSLNGYLTFYPLKNPLFNVNLECLKLLHDKYN